MATSFLASTATMARTPDLVARIPEPSAQSKPTKFTASSPSASPSKKGKEIVASTLSALPAPGLAIFPDLIAKKQETLIMKAESMSRSWKISLQDGTPLLTITNESLSLSRRKTISTAQGQALCQLRRQKRGKYYAETSSGQNIWNLSSKTSWFSSNNTVSFPNAADGGREVEMEMKNSGSKMPSGILRWGNVDVAVVEKESWKMRAEYHITVAEGCDMFLPVALVCALDDKARAARAGAAGGGGGGC